MTTIKPQKVAIVYDWVDKWGGAERVLLTLFEIFPEAVLYTSYYDFSSAPWAKDINIKSSFIQKLPDFIKQNRIASTMLYPFAFESFDFNGYDLVISVTSSFAKSVITRPETKHICYLLTPTRFLWLENKSSKRLGLLNSLSGPYKNYLKKWDLIVANRPDKYISISNTVKTRIKNVYNKTSDTVYPPFDIEYWSQIKKNLQNKKQITNDYYLVVSRLEPYKNVDIVVNTFNQMKDKKLIIVGTGSQELKLKKVAEKNISFVNNLNDTELAEYYQNANSLIMMQDEDFGYTSLEAQFFGTPVISNKKSGASETIINNKTGLLVDSLHPSSLKQTIDKFELLKYTLRKSTLSYGVNNINKFSKQNFIKQFTSIING